MNTEGIIGHGAQLRYINSMLKSGLEPQVLMFSGISGIGKRRIAKRLLAALFCSSKRPCLSCKDCYSIEKDNHPDVITLSPNEKGTIAMGDESLPGSVRWLLARLSKKSQSGRYGVIIDGAEQLSSAAQNALLKILEEPPQNTLIIIITSGKRFILPTILSRVTEISFRGLSAEQVLQVLKQQNFQGPQLDKAAQMCGGSLEAAMILMKDNSLQAVESLIASIASFVKDRGMLDSEFDLLQKKLGAETLLFILANSFRVMLLAKIKAMSDESFFPESAFLDEEILAKLIKISLSLSRGLDFNMLPANSFKAMLYSIDEMPPAGLPKFA